jgi:flagellar protein FlaI
MIDLLVNSLRMRPDRIIVGEVRRQREAEVLFEAMHTGHSVYATIHADNSEECVTRLTAPPINLPKSVLPSLGGIVVQFRNRRTGIRRTIEFSEITEDGSSKQIYRWDPKEDKLNKVGEISRLLEQLSLYTGMTEKEIEKNLNEKEKILKWMVNKKYFDVNIVGKIAADYYIMEDEVLEAAEKNKDWEL